VERSFDWYQSLFGQPKSAPAHDYFGQILDTDGTVLLCLHRWGEHGHPTLITPDRAEPGNGLLLFFRVDDFDDALLRGRTLVKQLEEEPQTNRPLGLESSHSAIQTVTTLWSARLPERDAVCEARTWLVNCPRDACAPPAKSAVPRQWFQALSARDPKSNRLRQFRKGAGSGPGVDPLSGRHPEAGATSRRHLGSRATRRPVGGPEAAHARRGLRVRTVGRQLHPSAEWPTQPGVGGPPSRACGDPSSRPCPWGCVAARR